jgi:hypothetical protein
MWRNCTKSRILRMWISVTQKKFNSPTSCNLHALTHCTYMLYHSMISFMVYTNWNIHQLLVEPSQTWNTFSQGIFSNYRCLQSPEPWCVHAHINVFSGTWTTGTHKRSRTKQIIQLSLQGWDLAVPNFYSIFSLYFLALLVPWPQWPPASHHQA